MSHYAMLVTDTDKVSLDEQLAPYDENGGENEEYLKFEIEVRKEEERDFVNEQIEKYERISKKADDEQRKRWANEQLSNFKDILTKSDEEIHKYIKEYGGYEENDEGLDYTRNPQAKWDWYSIGGRWNNHLKLKNGTFANITRKKDIDVEHLEAPYFAILHDGEWHQKGEMWCFAMVDGEKQDDEWKTEWKQILDTIDDNAEITLVDIHI